MAVLVEYSQTTPTRWANGNGTTSELISWGRSQSLSGGTLPPWRLSVARLAGATAFSGLPEVQRLFLPVGTDVTLVVNGTARRVPDRTGTAFSGSDVVELLAVDRRPAHAVNLMCPTTGHQATEHRATPRLVVGSTADPLFGHALVAVPLGSTVDVDRFDVLTPGPGDHFDPAVAVVMLLSDGDSSG